MHKTIELVGVNPTIRMFVCSTPNLRALLVRNRMKLIAGCNYVHEWKDTNGYGLCLGYSTPSPPDPKSRAEAEARRRAQGALYRHPGYDPIH